MSDTNDNVAILINGKEIEPNGLYDFSFRRVPSAKVPLYRGLAGQLTVNPDDKYRLQAWYGDKLGHNEQAVLQSDFDSAKYLAAFKNISVDCLNKTLTGTNFTINPTEYGLVLLHIMDTVTLSILTPKQVGTKLQLIVENLYKNSELKFAPSVSLKWAGSEPKLPTDANKTYCISLIWTGSMWIGEQNLTSNTSSGSADISACLNASVMSLGYCLPAGASSAGEYAEKYALFSGIVNYSDDELINITQVATNIGNVNTVASAKDEVITVKNNLKTLTKVVDNLAKIEDLLKRYEALEEKDSSTEA